MYTHTGFYNKRSGSNHNNLAVIFQVDTTSISKDEENPQACDIYYSDEGEHRGPRQRDLNQVTWHRDQHQSCATHTEEKDKKRLRSVPVVPMDNLHFF